MKTVYGISILTAILAGCAGQATRDSEPDTVRGDKDAASQLYAGQPSVVHATEFPVTAAAEGIQRGDAAWRQGKHDLAVYLYVQSLAYDATSAEPFLKIGAIHERLGNRALAVKAFELALAREPESAGANERLGLLYLQSQRNEDAQARFEKAIALDPDRWQSHNGLGIAADRRGDFIAAIGHYDTAHVLEPRSANIVNNRGYSHYLSGDLASAESDFRLAISLGALPGTWTNLGKSQAARGNYPDALDSLLKEADLATAYNVLGLVTMERGELDTAKRYFTDAITASPRYFQAAHDNLARVNERLARSAEPPTRLTQADAKVYAKGSFIGTVTRGRQVAVLHTQGTNSLVRYRDPDGRELTGWIASASLGDDFGKP